MLILLSFFNFLEIFKTLTQSLKLKTNQFVLEFKNIYFYLKKAIFFINIKKMLISLLIYMFCV